MKIYTLVIILTFLTLKSEAQNYCKAEYTVEKIVTRDEYHLIFLTNKQNKYTLYSPISINVYGCKLQKDSSYVLNLKTEADTLANGLSFTPMNYKDVLYFDQYTKDEIGKLCTSNDVIGLIIMGAPCPR